MYTDQTLKQTDISVLTEPAVKEKQAADRLILLVTLLAIFLMAARTPLDNDFWWHLRAGQQTLLQGHPLLHDIFSFTRSGESWTNHSWLAEVGMAWLFQWGGFLATGIAVALIATTSMGLLLLEMDGPAILRAFILVFSSIVAAWVWTSRPEILSLLLLSLTSLILFEYKWHNRNYLWGLIPIFVLWSNVHAGYVLGLLLIGATLVGEIINHLFAFDEEHVISRKRLGTIAIWGFLSGLATLINPNGIQTWLVVFQTVQVQALQQFVSEWASPDFHMVGQQSLLWLLFAVLGSMGLSGRKIDGSDLVELVLFGMMAFIARRNYGPFAIIAAPILSRHLWPAITTWWERFRQKNQNVEKLFARLKGYGQNKPIRPIFHKSINLGIVGLFAFVAFIKLYAVTSPELISLYQPEFFPQQAVAWIQEHHPAGPMFNSYNWGGYLIWALPEYPVFIDGRTDLYNDEIMGQWLTVVNMGKGWQQILDQWNIRLIVLEPTHPIVNSLSQNGWQLEYQDKNAVVYGR